MNPQRHDGFDWLRGVAALFIVAVHLSVGTTPSWSRLAAFGAQTCIELFAAVSGFLLALRLDRSRDDSPASLVLRRARRLLPAFLKWTVFYLAALSLMDWCFGVPNGYLEKMGPRFIAASVLRGAAEVHLWFVPSLFAASAVLVAADRFLCAPLRNAWTYLVCGAAIGLAGSCAGTNFFFHDVRLFGWTMLGMGLSRIVRNRDGSDAMRCARVLAAFSFPFALVAAIFAQGTVFWHLADMAVALALLLALSGTNFPGSRIGAFLSRTSLDVYYSHVFVSRALSVAICAWHPEPLGFAGAFCLWLLVWSISLAFAAR